MSDPEETVDLIIMPVAKAMLKPPLAQEAFVEV